MIYYTDGACSKNTGEGVAVPLDASLPDDNLIWQFQDSKSPTTNNEMELMAILTALKHISSKIENNTFLKSVIYSDSAYCVNLINSWMYSWEKNGWKRPKNQEVKNLEIIKQIYELAHLADIRKVSGHSGVKWNEYVDGLATGKIKINEHTPQK